MIKILIVEDETIVALDTKSTLIKLGYEVTDIVTTYEEALLSFSKNKPDIILMDIFLKNSLSGIDIAKKISYDMSSQAVGGAVGHNPISIIVPCHRVVGFDGKLTGYAGGLENKVKLLELEGVKIRDLKVIF